MIVPGSANALLLRATAAYSVPYSLRFRASNSAYLTRTPGAAGNRKTWSWSDRVKRGLLASQRTLFFAGATSTTAGAVNIFFDSSDRLNATIYDGGTAGKITSAVFRDPSAFYDILVAVDTTQVTGTDRVKIYVNGVQLSAWATDTAPTLNMDTAVNNTTVHYIGCANDSGGSREGYFDGVMAQARLIDGQALTPGSFGETNATSGQWVPKNYTGTYGTNGFLLDFSDAASTTTIGYDAAGSNDWTTSGISVTSGSTFDQMTDTPTNNYATLNPLVPVSRGSLRNANLEYTSGSAATHGSVAGPAIPTTGEWCWEVTACKSVNNEMIGVANIQNNPQLPAAGTEIGNGSRGDYGYRSDGNKYNNGSGGAYGATYTAGDVIGVVWNATAGTLTFYKNGSSQGTAYSSITQVEGKFAPASSNAETGYDIFNFGQRPFAYSYGSAKALNTANLSTPSIQNGASQFQATTRTGTGASASVSSLAFQPDLVWIKSRSNATNNNLFDSSRGTTDYLISNSSAAAATNANTLTAFNSNGYTLGTDAGSVGVNINTNTYVDWSWKKGVTPGFDIVTYTGNATNRTISHSLGVVPHLMLVKNRTSATGWTVYHRNMDATPQNGNLTLNSTAAYGVDSTSWNNTAPTSSVFSVGTANAVNGNTNSLINYLWTSISGFSLMGSYTGNGSADGPFVWCGFKPRFVLIKRTDTSGNGWWMVDTVRQTFNQITNGALTADSSAAEGGAGYALDVLSNGFKPRGTGSDYNASGATYIFAAFAESPFKYSTAR